MDVRQGAQCATGERGAGRTHPTLALQATDVSGARNTPPQGLRYEQPPLIFVPTSDSA